MATEMHVLQKLETPGRSRWPRRSRIAIVAVVAALLLATAAALFIAAPGSATPPSPLAYSAGCPQDPMQQVPNAGSYRVEVRCARIGGKVLAYRLNRSYDDLELTVSPAPAYQFLLPAANHGRFVVRITGPDLSTVQSPELESDDVFYGSWVENRATHALMLLPVWRIAAKYGNGVNPDTQLFVAAQARHSGQSLKVSPGIPATLRPGVILTLPVTVTWRIPAAGKKAASVVPASQVGVLAEITNAFGRPVAWKAAQTGALGTVNIRLPLIASTGRYTCHLYVIAAGGVTTVVRKFNVGEV
jgi:hypothetical protein